MILNNTWKLEVWSPGCKQDSKRWVRFCEPCPFIHFFTFNALSARDLAFVTMFPRTWRPGHVSRGRPSFPSSFFLCHFFTPSCLPWSFPAFLFLLKLSLVYYVVCNFFGSSHFYFQFQLWLLKMSTCEVFNQVCDLSFNSYSMPGPQPITWTSNLQQSPSFQARKLFCVVFCVRKKLFELPVREWQILLKCFRLKALTTKDTSDSY